MKGLVFLGKRQSEVREFPDPVPGPGQVVVAMKAAAICGSDVHIYRLSGEGPGSERFQYIQGHEPCGVVKSIGSGVTTVKPGDRVVIYHYLGCGHCEYCASGEFYYCKETRGYGWHVHGSMADLVLTDERNCLLLPEELSYVDGAFIGCIASTAYSSLKKLDVSGRDVLLVSGLGPVGLVMAMLGKASGAKVIGVDIVEERLALGRSVGADLVVNADTTDLPQAVRDFTKGQGASTAFDSTGIVDANKNTIRSMGYHGRGVFVGMSYSKDGINFGSGDLGAMWKQLVLMGSLVYPKSMYWEITRFLIDHKIPLESIVTHCFRIEDGVKAMQLADTGKTGKIFFQW